MKGARMRRTMAAVTTGLGLALLAGCSSTAANDDSGRDAVDVAEALDGTPAQATLAVEGLPATAPAGVPLTVTVTARDAAGSPAQGATIGATVTRGGGRLAAATAVTGADGRATFTWTPGPAPVLQRLSLAWNDVVAAASLDATLSTPVAPAPFGDVNAFLSGNGVSGSTEDLVFTPDGTHLVLGVPGGLIQMDTTGNATTMALTGDALGWTLGLAYDAEGVLWGADANGKALRRIDTEGKVTTIAGGTTAFPLKYPNDITVGPGGRIILADSCLGKVLVFNPDGSLVSSATFDMATEGGANGVAVDPAGDALWVTTENTSLLCTDGSDFAAVNGGLYRFALAPDGTLGERTDVAPGLANYADGVTFDAEGNLYVMVDRLNPDDFTLTESAVLVRPAEGGDLRRFLVTTDKAMANAAFGPAAFGQQTMYLALIAMPLVLAPEARGVVRIDVGIGGLPLIPK